MGQKVNYNPKGKKLDIKKITIIFIIVIVLLGLLLSIKEMRSHVIMNSQSINNTATLYKPVKECKTLEELLGSYQCRVIQKEESDSFIKVTLSFDVDLYTGNRSNETHFLNICKAVAQFIDYKNFELLDKDKGIDIEVQCEKPNIVSYKINGDPNYYLNANSKTNKNVSTNTTLFSVQSPELQSLIDGDWVESKVKWGTEDSICDGYHIYFEEGIQYKTVAQNVYNVIFTENYKNQVVGGLTTNSTSTAIEAALGKPSFLKNEEIYGYVSEDVYLFFDLINHQISTYPVIKITEQEARTLTELIQTMNETNNVKEFAVELTDFWNDYDLYEYDTTYMDLKYTLKGVEITISSDSFANGIFIYPNYTGSRDIIDLENVYMKDMDCVFEQEENRVVQEMMNRLDQGDFTQEDYEKFLGTNFSVKFQASKQGNLVGPRFYSRDKSYADSELDKRLEITSYIWFNENIFLYSVEGEGIYAYDCVERKNQKILDDDTKIMINDIEDNELTYNNTEKLKIVVK